MKRVRLTRTLAVIPVLIAWPNGAAVADAVFKCTDGGNVTYSSEPDAANCQRIDLQVIEPNPEDAARLAAERQQRALAEQAAEEKQQRERLIRAQELEAQAAVRRALAAEEQARLLREQQQASIALGYYYPSWWGYPAWGPAWKPWSHRHRRLADKPAPPAQDFHFREETGDDGLRSGSGRRPQK